jgi:hypothetical protein
MARRSHNAKHLLYDASSRRFFARTGEWTRDTAKAIVFRDLASVVQFCLRHGFKDAEAMIELDSGKRVRLPICA